MAGDTVENTVRANVRAVVKQIQEAEPLLPELVKERRLKIVGAVYHLDTGLMELLP